MHLGPPEVVGRTLAEGAEPWRLRPTRGLRGRGADGRFLTAQAKEYPNALRRSLMVAILKGIRHRIQRDGVSEIFVPDFELTQWVVHMCSQSEACTRQSHLPDYQRA